MPLATPIAPAVAADERSPLPWGIDRLRGAPPVAYALLDQAVISGANFLLVVAVARSIGVHDYGLFSLALSVLLFASSLAYAIVVQPVSVLLPERDGAAVNAYLARVERAQRWLMPGLLLVGVAAMAVLPFPELIVATALATASRIGIELHRRVAYALHDGLRALLIDTVAYAPLVLGAIALIAHPLRFAPWAPMAVIAGTGFAGWIAGALVHRHVLRTPRALPLATVARQHWDFGRWNLGGALAMWGASQLYPFLVAGLLGLSEVGILTGSVRIVGVFNIVVQGIEASATPRLRRLYVAGDLDRYRRRLRSLVLWSSLALMPLLAVIELFPHQVLGVLLGDGFTAGAAAIQLVALAQFLTFLSRLAAIGLNSLKEPRPGFWAQVICAALTLAAGPLVVRHFGLTGACVALMVNAAVNCAVLGLAFRRRLARAMAGEGPGSRVRGPGSADAGTPIPQPSGANA